MRKTTNRHPQMRVNYTAGQVCETSIRHVTKRGLSEYFLMNNLMRANLKKDKNKFTSLFRLARNNKTDLGKQVEDPLGRILIRIKEVEGSLKAAKLKGRFERIFKARYWKDPFLKGLQKQRSRMILESKVLEGIFGKDFQCQSMERILTEGSSEAKY